MSNAGGSERVPEQRRWLPQTPGQWVKALWPGVLACVLVVIESNDSFSTEHTSGILYPLWCKLFGCVDAERWDVIHHLIRKCGHLTGFAFVGQCFYYCATHVTGRRVVETLQQYRRRCSLWALLGSFLLASYDEIHQSFIPSRGSSFHDVMIDTSGAWIGLIARFGLIVFFGSEAGKSAGVMHSDKF